MSTLAKPLSRDAALGIGDSAIPRVVGTRTRTEHRFQLFFLKFDEPGRIRGKHCPLCIRQAQTIFFILPSANDVDVRHGVIRLERDSGESQRSPSANLIYRERELSRLSSLESCMIDAT